MAGYWTGGRSPIGDPNVYLFPPQPVAPCSSDCNSKVAGGIAIAIIIPAGIIASIILCCCWDNISKLLRFLFSSFLRIIPFCGHHTHRSSVTPHVLLPTRTTAASSSISITTTAAGNTHSVDGQITSSTTYSHDPMQTTSTAAAVDVTMSTASNSNVSVDETMATATPASTSPSQINNNNYQKRSASTPSFEYTRHVSYRIDDDDKLECVVCLQQFKDGEKGRLLMACGHCFHAECIDEWLKLHPSCPICRTTVVRGNQ